MSPQEIIKRKARFTEHLIITVLKSVEAGGTVKDVCREAGISEASYYNYKEKYDYVKLLISKIYHGKSLPSVKVIFFSMQKWVMSFNKQKTDFFNVEAVSPAIS